MSATRTMGIDVTDVDTTKKLPLGFVYREPASTDDMGEKHWVYVYNSDSAILAIGSIVIRDPSAKASSTVHDELVYGVIIAGASTPSPATSVVGVAQHAIAIGSYGFVQAKGKGLVQCGTANITEDTPITSGGSSAGDAIDFAGGVEECIIGMFLEAETTNDTSFDAWLNCQGA